MANSDISAIYDALAALTILVEGSPPTVRNLADIKPSLRAADLPLRMLLPVGTDTRGQTLDYATLQVGSASIIWTLTDVLFLRPVAQGQGLETAPVALAEYAQDYVNALLSQHMLVKSGGNRAQVLNVSVAPGIYHWPIGANIANGGTAYFGVWCVVTVKESMA